LKGKYVFLGVLIAKIDGDGKLTAIESSRIQIERF
jgi:hypothetical protein